MDGAWHVTKRMHPDAYPFNNGCSMHGPRLTPQACNNSWCRESFLCLCSFSFSFLFICNNSSGERPSKNALGNLGSSHSQENNNCVSREKTPYINLGKLGDRGLCVVWQAVPPWTDLDGDGPRIEPLWWWGNFPSVRTHDDPFPGTGGALAQRAMSPLHHKAAEFSKRKGAYIFQSNFMARWWSHGQLLKLCKGVLITTSLINIQRMLTAFPLIFLQRSACFQDTAFLRRGTISRVGDDDYNQI
eukprot:26544-Pelagomonas_calceolata.AAC.2